MCCVSVIKAMHMVLLLFVSCSYLHVVTTTPYKIHPAEEDGEFGIILDGGSTGTKLKIYKWRKQSSTSQKYVLELELVESVKFKPGISQYATRLSEVAEYLSPMITRAESVVPSRKRSKTPIYFMATAGLRVLSESSTIALLETVESYLEGTAFLTQGDNTRVLSGEEEGVYAWIAANYLRGFFWSNKPVSQSVGVLEMGGGSTQIAFIPDAPIYANMFPVRIGGQKYHLYAHSYLFYGQNYIVSRINKYLIGKNSESPGLENPCMLVGDNTTVTTPGGSVHIAGSANTFKCLEILEVFLRTAEDSWCYPKPCAIGRTYQPAVGDTLFYAISAFVYAPSYLQAVDHLGRLNISLLLDKTEVFCSKTLQDAISSGLPAEFASSYCTMGLYIPSLFVDAYGFEISSQSIYVASEIDNTNIDWALGAMLLQLDNNMELLANCDTSGAMTFGHMTEHCAILMVTMYILVKYHV